jgi:acyl transferase domain-containing protein/NAD(P)H-dependent flavin oxidoreductase YrpB (nitropropane dioxygenase family)/NAD(P)-dependent dehydrogenase (short-subunit alcohol dehydrogenase family)
MIDEPFDFIVQSPAGLAHCGGALAASREGAAGVLDFELFPAADERALANLDHFRSLLKAGQRGGIRVNASHAALAAAAPSESLLVIALMDPDEQIALARASASEHLLVEVSDGMAAARLREAGIKFDGLIARGSESGGWTSTTGAFVLAQKLAASGERVFLHGAIGPLAAAAARVAGCAGVVLSSELLLMSDSPLEEDARAIASSLSLLDTALLGDRLGAPLRVVQHGTFPAYRILHDIAQRLEADGGEASAAHWREAAAQHAGWRDGDVWPVGSGIGLAAGFAARYGTIGTLLHEWRREIDAAIRCAAGTRPFEAGALLARSHGTRVPIVQGAMTRVSDNAQFASAVAGGGALPMIALALLQGVDLERVLAETGRALDGHPWGAGILGFVPPEIREQQIAALRRARPPFALIAGGRPDQARQLEEAGIATYLHLPTPAFIAPFFEAGVRRFIFEGNESGGHVGPLAGFPLWETSVTALLDVIPKGEEKNVHVLFAGGIHDAVSSAMASIFAAPLAARGIATGILMGSAYLFTREAVESGAIVERFQREALTACRTVTLESGTGHANRCALTPFAYEFQQRRRELLRAGATIAEMKSDLDRLGLGRLRLATKGKLRDGDAIVDAPDERQRRDGMYMIGEVATLRSAVTTIAGLHEAVSSGACEVVASRVASAEPAVDSAPSDVAIVGMAALLPGADDVESFWDNMLHARSAIREIPPERWDWRLLFDEDKNAADHSYSRWGGFFNEVVFDCLRFGIPPATVPKIGVAQLLALELVHRALADAGYDRRPFDRERVAMLVAEAEHGGLLHHQHIARTILPFVAGDPPPEMFERLAPWTEDSFPGSLSNITAGRVSNRFDFGGPNFAVDAACASSLTALDLAVQELESRRSNMAIVAGIDTGQHPYGFVAFSKTQALSPTGQSRPFDKNADGIVISEGVAVAVLKRLADAERDGDRIYAVVKSVAGSSDGKAMGLTAPRPAGQIRALRRAYGRAGVRPSSIGYYEAHGTGTAVGDRAEAETVVSVMAGDGAPARRCAVGSAKALVGHTKTAAGLVGVVKASLALRHGVIPPHRVAEPLDAIANPGSPLYTAAEPWPWLRDGSATRRAGVSAFGFGGTNSHAVLEEYRGNVEPVAPGSEHWPAELLCLRSETRDELLARAADLARQLRAGAAPRLRDLTYSCALTAGSGTWAAAFVASDLNDALAKLESVAAAVEHGADGISVCRGSRVSGEVALLFPGQASQYTGMVREAALYLPPVRERIESASALLRDELPEPLAHILFSSENARLTETAYAQPAIGAASAALAALLRAVGVQPSMIAGHSYGEYVALHAAGALGWEDLLRLSVIRSRAMQESGRAAAGAMIAAAEDESGLAPYLEREREVVVANRNTPSQTVLSGPKDAVARIAAALRDDGIAVVPLATSGAFHSPLMRGAREVLAGAIAATAFAPPAIPVYGHRQGQRYSADIEAMRACLIEQLLDRVDFVAVIEEMYANGARVFIESGPADVLTAMVDKILGERPHVALSLDRRRGGLSHQLAAIAEIWTQGLAPTVDALFAGRGCRRLDLRRLVETTAPTPPPEHAFLVNGMCARSLSQGTPTFGRLPLRDSNSPIPPRPEGATAMSDSPRPPEAAAPVIDVYESYQTTMRQFLKTQEEVLRMFVGRAPNVTAVGQPAQVPLPATPAPLRPEVEVRALGSAAPPPAPQPVDMASHAPATAGADRDSASAVLIEAITQITGYPASMIGVDADLEGDLGVDSIRRLQILQNFRRALPAVIAGRVERANEQVARAKSVRAILDALFDDANVEAPMPVVRVDARLHVRDTAVTPLCPRFVMAAVPQPLASQGGRLDGTFVVTGDASAVAVPLLGELASRGARAIAITDAECRDREALARRLHEIAAGERVTGVIHLAGLVPGGIADNYDEWRSRTRYDAKSLFQILNFAASRDITLHHVVAASAFGGAFGRDGAAAAVPPSAGAAVGLLKTYQLEHPSTAKAIDFDLSRPAGEIARQIVDELAAGDVEGEVGFIGGMRHVFTAVPSPLGSDAPEPSRRDWIILITGGARGITSRVARALAAPGQKLVVVGRARLAGEEDPSLHGIESVDMLRKQLIDKARRANPNVKPTQIDAELSELLRDREIRYNIEQLRGAGVEVEYRAVDVRSADGFQQLLDETYRRYGRIDAVVHGAGVIADKLLADKSHDAFEHVFDTKVDSTYLLMRHLRPESLRLMMLFASTAGRFGNRGQSDYAAANEVLNRFAWRMHAAWPSVRVASINWGPWLGSGMASENVNEMFRARGVEPIDPRAGVEFALRELGGPRADVEVIAGDGPWRVSAAPAQRNEGVAATP